MKRSEQRYRDQYSGIAGSMTERLQHLYWALRLQYSGLDRFSIALYDPANGVLSAFSCDGESRQVLAGYSAPLAAVPSLQELVDERGIRVVNDMRNFRSMDSSEHTEQLLGQGYRASFTMPLFENEQLMGVLFLNSHQIDYFDDTMVVYCSLWGHLVEQVLARFREDIPI